MIQLSGSALIASLAGCPGDQNGGETGTSSGSGGSGGGTSMGETETETAMVESPETGTAGRESPMGETETEAMGETETQSMAETETTIAETESPMTETPSGPTPAVSVSDQDTTGESVTVDSVSIDRTGWLVIHPEADGAPDATTHLAAVGLESGEQSDVEVTLDEPVTESQTLYAMLHYDDPADGEFAFTPDNGEDPPVTVDGQAVVESFDVTVS